jgi:hypothetical protein
MYSTSYHAVTLFLEKMDMDINTLLQSPDAMLVAAAAGMGVLLAILLVVYSWRRGSNGARTVSLQDAAAKAYQSAKRNRMAIVSVAERAGPAQNAVAWFVQSIAAMIPVYRRRARSGRLEKMGKVDPLKEPAALRIRKRDLATYLRWARSMQ